MIQMLIEVMIAGSYFIGVSLALLKFTEYIERKKTEKK